MFLLSTTSILSCKRWFVNCLTVKFASVLSDRIIGVENRWFGIKDTFHWWRFLVSAIYLKFLLKCKVQHYLFQYGESNDKDSLKYWHRLCCMSWKITNLNHTLIPRQTFLADTIYNGVAGNYCCIWKILTLNRRSFKNLALSLLVNFKA